MRMLDNRSGVGRFINTAISSLGCHVFRKGLVLVGVLLFAACCLSGCGGKSSISGSSSGSGPTSVSVSAAAAFVDGLDSTTITASVANDSNSDGVTWTLNGVGTLSNMTSTSVTYTAPAAASISQSVTVTAVSVKETTKYSTATLTIPVSPAITTGSGALAGQVGTTYSVQLVGSGGITPYTWTVASGYTLPAGLSLSTAGVLSGTPMALAAGTTNVQIQMKDAGTPTALSASRTLGVSISAAPAITFGGSMPATGGLNQAYAGSAAASGGGGALTYTVSSGSLPTGLSLNAATGAVTGTITVGGTYNFSIKAADAFGDSAIQSYQIVAGYPALTIAPASGSLPFAVTGQSYAQTLTASGGSGSGYVWTVSGLSNGFTSLANGSTVTINGPATSAGTVNFTASVKDGEGDVSSTLSYSIPVYSPLSLPTSNPPTLGWATLSLPYTGTVVGSGGSGNYAWTVTGLPSDNLSYSTNGGTLTLTGTPGTATTVSFTAKLTDTTTNLTVGPYTYTVPVYATVTLPSPNPASLGPGDAGINYIGTITAAGGSGNYSWTVTGLSDGLSSSPSGGTLTISGTPAASGTVSFNASVKDNSTNTTVGPFTYTITVYSALVLPAPDPVSLPSTGYSGLAYTGTIGASGGSGTYSWQVTGLSDNLAPSPSGATLTVSGTPGATPATVTFSVKLTDTATNFSITQTGYNIAIGTPPPVGLPTPNPASLPFAVINQPYTGSIVASGGVTPYTWSVNGVSIPSNGTAVLIADSIMVSSNGTNVLSVGGTPTVLQTVNLTNVKVTDLAGSTQTQSYTIEVDPVSKVSGQISLNPTCGGGSASVPTITVSLLTSPGGTVFQTVTTDTNGNFVFPAVLNGSYTISPSITGPSSAFYPATQSVTVNGADITRRKLQRCAGVHSFRHGKL